MENIEKCKKDEAIIKRLRKIEGQVKGIQRMVDEGKYCGDILIQVAAVKSAINKVGGIILESHMKDCLHKKFDNIDENLDGELEKLVDIMIKYTK
ncbi:MAG: metal-sensitive transcriptional regulator [Tissierellales bacterium]|jgi:DNA-binding FrmR family transcriptional regulator|nr:metal-sensitive transcriptional regulator [Tissierellales bacterium]